jgi:hypothetical protein
MLVLNKEADMQLRLTALCIAITVAICHEATAQAPRVPSDAERVQTAVAAIVGPTKVAGMPTRFAVERRLMVEAQDAVLRAPIEGDPELEPEAPPAPMVGGEIRISAACFDGWAYGNMSGAEVRKAWVESMLKDRLILHGMRHQLTDAQLAKLHLAGRGDIKHLFDEIETRRRGFESVRHDVRQAQLALRNLNAISSKFQNGPFGDGSLFAKTLAKILADRRNP